MNHVENLNQVLSFIKKSFIGKDEIIDLLGICLIAKENAFLYGPPGTAKSAIVRLLSQCIEGGKNFEYLLTRFTEPNEIFGPFDIRKLKEGDLVTNTEGMLPEAALVFLDEIFNANSAILNSLLMALNERIFRRGKETRQLPTLMFVGASNIVPQDDTLNALLDRFLVRVKCDYVHPDALQEVLLAGWKLENANVRNEKPLEMRHIKADEIRQLQHDCRAIDLSNIRKQYIQVIYSLRNTGIKVSDRRAVKLQNLIAASALSCGRKVATLADLWVLKYIWDTEEQMEILDALINHVIEKDNTTPTHPQAFAHKLPNVDEIFNDVKLLLKKWDEGNLTFEAQNMVKDKLRYLQSRCDWVKNREQKQYIQQEIELLWKKILHTT